MNDTTSTVKVITFASSNMYLQIDDFMNYYESFSIYLTPNIHIWLLAVPQDLNLIFNVATFSVREYLSCHFRLCRTF